MISVHVYISVFLVSVPLAFLDVGFLNSVAIQTSVSLLGVTYDVLLALVYSLRQIYVFESN
jgi:hypothetical protein